MARCVACGTRLDPPVRTPHTVYVKIPRLIDGHDYCCHHTWGVADHAGARDGGDKTLAGAGKVDGLGIAIRVGKRLTADRVAPSDGNAGLSGETTAVWSHLRDKVLTTVALAVMSRVEHANLLAGRAVHVPYSEVGCAVGTSRTSVNPWSVFTADQESHLLELP